MMLRWVLTCDKAYRKKIALKSLLAPLIDGKTWNLWVFSETQNVVFRGPATASQGKDG
jgi:hypothetical protein